MEPLRVLCDTSYNIWATNKSRRKLKKGPNVPVLVEAWEVDDAGLKQRELVEGNKEACLMIRETKWGARTVMLGSGKQGQNGPLPSTMMVGRRMVYIHVRAGAGNPSCPGLDQRNMMRILMHFTKQPAAAEGAPAAPPPQPQLPQPQARAPEPTAQQVSLSLLLW